MGTGKGTLWLEQWMLDRIREAEDRLAMTAVLKDLCRLKLDRYHGTLHETVRQRGHAVGMCATTDLERALDHILDEKGRAEKRKQSRAKKLIDAIDTDEGMISTEKVYAAFIGQTSL